MGRRYREKEERNEFHAAIAVGKTSSKNILLFHNLELVWASYETKTKGRGKNKIPVETRVDVRGQDVFAHSKEQAAQTTLWDRFLLFKNRLNKDLISLTNDTDRLVEEYYDYLINSYPPSDRYHNLDLNGQMWLRKVVRLAVIYHIMENKLAGYLKSEHDENDDRDYFCNDFAVYFYTLTSNNKIERSELASVMNRIVEDESKKKALFDEFFDRHTERLQETIKPLLRIVTTNIKQLEGDDTDNEKGIMII